MTSLIYAITGVLVFCISLFALAVRPQFLHKVLALNVAGSGVFLIYIALAYRGGEQHLDPVPQAMVITGIVIAVSTTALALVLALKLNQLFGVSRFSDADSREGE